MENVTFCQSCAMPLTSSILKGTNADGTLSQEFCTYCYQKGDYLNDCTMEEMIEICVKPMCEHNPELSEDEARAQMREFFPTLKRWTN